jgi:hypothetical protein
MLSNVPIRQDRDRVDDSAQIRQASPVSSVADSKQTFPLVEKGLDQDLIVS